MTGHYWVISTSIVGPEGAGEGIPGRLSPA